MTAENSDTFLQAETALDDDDPLAPGNTGSAHLVDGVYRTQINIALQLLQTGSQVIFVRGAQGMGKSAFLLGLSQHQPDGFRLNRITATANLELADLLTAFAAGPKRADPLEILRSVVRQGWRPALLVDDADQLREAVLSQLLSLWTTARTDGTPFGLVLTGSPDFDAQLAACTTLRSDRLHTIKLHPFLERQTIEYLTQRLDAAGILSMELLSEADMRNIHAQAQGVPSRIDDGVRRLLHQRVTKNRQASPKPGSAKRRITVIATASLLVLAAALAAVLQFAERGQPKPDQPAVVANDAPALAMPEEPSIATAITSETPEDAVAEPPVALMEPVAALTETPAVASTPEPSEPSIEAPPVPQESTPMPVQQQEPVAAIPTTTPAFDNDWLRSRRASHFTIQLVAAHDADALSGYIRQHGLDDQAALLQVQRDKSHWYVVVLGDYPDRAAGRAALEKIPLVLRQDGAWLRSFGELQQLAQD